MKQIEEIGDWQEMIGEVIHGDCLEVMKKIPDKAIDLVLTDPPYGINMSKGTYIPGKKKGITGKRRFIPAKWDNKKPHPLFFNELIRISKEQIIFGGNYFSKELPQSRGWIYWDKKISKNQGSNFADGELIWTSFDKNVKKYTYGWIGLDYLNNPDKDKKQHPTQKPLELFKWILQNYSKEGDLIFDGFAGSFTTARACKDMNRRWICCDLEEEYCKIGEERLKQELLF